jgi:hypothetical protein
VDHYISEILSSFSTISLAELDTYMLMNRVDTKYVFSSDKLTGLLKDLQENYRVLEIDSERIFSYCTTYLDTPDWLFYRQHMTQRGVRNKIRFRKYEQSGISFLEVKKRNNKQRTEKWRIIKDLNSGNVFDKESEDFIQGHFAQDLPPIEPVLVNRFKRITLAGINTEERVTVDFDLIFNDFSGNSYAIPWIGIIERKRFDFSNRSPLTKTLKMNSIYPTGFSKYCLGTAVLYDLPRKNLIKPKLLLLNKISNEYTPKHHAGQHFN